MDQTANAAFARYQNSRTPHAELAQGLQRPSSSMSYSQGMDQTLFESQLHRPSSHQPLQQQQQQPQPQRNPAQDQPPSNGSHRLYQEQGLTNLQHPRQLHHQSHQSQPINNRRGTQYAEGSAHGEVAPLPQHTPQHYYQAHHALSREPLQNTQPQISHHYIPQQQAAQAQTPQQHGSQQPEPKHKARLQPPLPPPQQQQMRQYEQPQQTQPQSSQVAPPPLNQHTPLQQYHSAQAQRQQETRQPRPHERSLERISSPQDQYQGPDQQQYVRPSDISPSVNYWLPNPITRPDHRAPMKHLPVPHQRSASRPALASSNAPAEPNQVAAQSRSPDRSPLLQANAMHESRSTYQNSPVVASSPLQLSSDASTSQMDPVLMHQPIRPPVSQSRSSPRVPDQPPQASGELDSSRRGSFLEDKELYNTSSPRKDPYTSSSRSTLGPQSHTPRKPSSTKSGATSARKPSLPSATSRPKDTNQDMGHGPQISPDSHRAPLQRPVIQQDHSSESSTPNSIKPVSAPIAASQPSPAVSQPPVGVKPSPSHPISPKIPQAIRPYMEPQMIKEYKQRLNQTAGISGTAAGRLSQNISVSSERPDTVPSVSKPIAASQGRGSDGHQTIVEAHSRSGTTTGRKPSTSNVAPAQPPRAQSSIVPQQKPDRMSDPSAPTETNTADVAATAPASRAAAFPKAPAVMNRSLSNDNHHAQTLFPRTQSITPSASSGQAAEEPSRIDLRKPASTSATPGLPDNFSPFMTTSSCPPVPVASNARPIMAAPVPATNRTSSPFPAHVDLTRRPRRGRPRKYPSPSTERPGSRLAMHSQSNTAEALPPSQHERATSGALLPSQASHSQAHPRTELVAPGQRLATTSKTPQSGSLPVYHSVPSTRNPASLALAQSHESRDSQPIARPLPVSEAQIQPQALARAAELPTSEPAHQHHTHSLYLPAAKSRKLNDGSRHLGPVASPGLAQPASSIASKFPAAGGAYSSPYSSQNMTRPQIAARPNHQRFKDLPNRKQLLNRFDIVESMNVTDVLLKDAYDPKTIARDILIAAGRHPQEKSLNHHLEPLRRRFKAVDGNSDLTTFRWDLVDPRVDYSPSVIQMVEAAYKAASVVSATSTERPLDAAPQQIHPSPNQTGSGLIEQQQHVPGSARDLPTAPLTSPADNRPVFNTSNPRSVVTRTDKSEANGSVDIVHHIPASSAATSTGKPSTPTAPPSLKFSAAHPTRRESHGGVNTVNSPHRSSALHPPTASSTTLHSTTSKSSNKPVPAPPTAVNLNAFGALPFKPPSYYSPLRPTAQPLPYSLPSLPVTSPAPKSPDPASHPPPPPPRDQEQGASAPVPRSYTPAATAKPKSKGQSASQEAAPPRTPSKAAPRVSQSPRGTIPRQSPLPKELPEPLVIIPTSPQAMAPPKRGPGRPPKSDRKIEVAIDNRPAPQYQVFRCQWTGCEAKLHNLQAIQTHMLGVHIPRHIVCAWEDCADKTPRAAADMWEHVDGEHITPMAWKQGDGPSVPTNEVETYDALQSTFQGRQDTMTLPADRDSVKIFSRIHGTQTSKQRARLMEEGGRQWKEQAGPQADLSDRPLSTPPRLRASRHGETAYTLSDVSVVI